MEDIIAIVEDINSKCNLREENNIIARYNATLDDKETNLWITQNPMNYSNWGTRTKGVDFVYKNARLGITLINNGLGEFSYSTINNLKRKIDHSGKTNNRTIFKQNHNQVDILFDPTSYTIADFEEFYKVLLLKEQQIRELEAKEKEIQQKRQELEAYEKSEALRKEKELLTKEIKKYQEERRILTMQQEEMSQVSRFIRQQGKLRHNPILDPIQNRIKTSHLYDNKVVVIDGGPGTGKTTTMIQRLKYLIDEVAIEEDRDNGTKQYNLTASQYNLLLDLIKKGDDWRFFSPSELLKNYLSDAMNHEGLSDTNSKVWNWIDFRRLMMREYGFFDTNIEEAVFRQFLQKDRLIFDEKGTLVALNEFYLNRIRQIPQKLASQDYSKYSWNILAKNILKMLGDVKDATLEDLILKFYNIELNYADQAQVIIDNNKEQIKALAEKLLAKTRIDGESFDKIQQIIFEQQQEDPDSGAEPIVDSEDDEDLSNEEKADKVCLAIRNWLKRYAQKQLDPTTKLSKKAEALSLILPPLMGDEDKELLPRIGEAVLFESLAKCTKGINALIFRGIPKMYKDFRRNILKNKVLEWNFNVLEKIVKSEGQRYINNEEQSLLIGFVNNLIKTVKRTLPTYTFKHKYVDTYELHMRPVIGIDEVTDFSIIDIMAMASFTRTDISSITLCGDMMQRLTPIGLKDWNELSVIFPDCEVVEMKASYRQSSVLLDVAKQLYKDILKKEANYVANLKTKKVPKPLAYISNDEYEKIEWISERISEVFKAYDKRLPAIAIFLNDKRAIPEFVELLSQTEMISGAGIKVVDGSSGMILGSTTDVRVYPIDVVKGMEFDVVFFHNIDKTNFDSDLVKRHMYVGLSRAAFFLAATLEKENEDITKYFSMDINWARV